MNTRGRKASEQYYAVMQEHKERDLIAHLLLNDSLGFFNDYPRSRLSLRDRILLSAGEILRKTHSVIIASDLVELLSDSNTFKYVGEDYLKQLFKVDLKQTEAGVKTYLKHILEEYNQKAGIESKFELQNVMLDGQYGIRYEFYDLYLETNDDASILNAFAAVLHFAETLKLNEVCEFDAVRGSWFKRFIFKVQTVLESEELKSKYRKLEHGIEVNAIQIQQSQVDLNEAQALKNVMESLQDIPKATVRLGSLLVVKTTGLNSKKPEVFVFTLSIDELKMLNDNPQMLRKPEEIIRLLDSEKSVQ